MIKLPLPTTNTNRRRVLQSALALGSLILAAACATPEAGNPDAQALSAAQGASTSAPAATTAVTPAPLAPAPTAMPHDQAVLAAAKDLFAKAQLPAGKTYRVVIDPLVDGVSGVQTSATDAMEKQVMQVVRSNFSQFEVKPFNAANVAELPLILVGTFTPINLLGKPDGEKDAYRVCLALADLRTGLIVSKGFARSQTAGVDSLPKPFFRDSPLWVNDAVVEGYIKTCQGSKAGDPIHPAYIDKVVAATAINEAMLAYNGKNYREALALYKTAERTAGSDQPRINMGLYLTNLALGQRQAAMKAFGAVVDYGLKNKRLGVKFSFRPGAANFTGANPLNDQWLKELAQQSAGQASCLEVSGHSSRGGSEPLNERVSLQRAEYVKQRMTAQQSSLANRLKTQGYGSRQVLIGTGKNDASDALDQRIEFKPTGC